MSKKSYKGAASASIDKFFSANDVSNTDKVQEVQKVYETQQEQIVQDVLKAQEVQQTQGKKGCKMQRINMAFTPNNIDFIRVIAKLKGQTMTQYVNDILDKEREENKALYDQIQELSKKI